MSDFVREYEKAIAAGAREAASEPRAVSARYDAKAARVIVKLSNGVVIAFPPSIAQGLRGAGVKELATVEITADGFGLHWEALDADLSVPGLAAGVFGSRSWMRAWAASAGAARTPRKAAAARENGRKGGRPRKAG